MGRPHYLHEEAAVGAEPVSHGTDSPSPITGDPLLDALGTSPTPIDLLVQTTGLSVSDCQQRLLMLELEGQATQQAGGWVRMTAPW